MLKNRMVDPKGKAQNETTPLKPATPRAVNPKGEKGGKREQKTLTAAQLPPEQDDPGTSRYVGYFRVKLGSKEFTSEKGQFLGRPYVRLSTYQHSSTRFVINDPDGSIRDSIAADLEVEVEVGFGDAERRNVFVGKVYFVGRLGEDGTVVDAVDSSYQLQGQTGSSVEYSGEVNADPKQATTQDEGIKDATVDADGKLAKRQAAFAGNPASQQTRPTPNTPSPSPAAAPAPVSSTQAPDRDAPTVPQFALSSSDFPDLLNEIRLAQEQPAPTSYDQLVNVRQRVGELQNQVNGRNSTPLAQLYTEAAGRNRLRFANNTNFATGAAGAVRLQETLMHAAQAQALAHGDVVIARGNTVRQVSPGQQEDSGVTIDWLANRGAFIGKPRCWKRSPLQLQSGYGSITVTGYSVNDKSMVGATVVTQSGTPNFDPNSTIQVPDWGQIKLGDPLFPGSSFTWADVSKGGQRIPQKAQMERAIKLAQAIEPIVKRSGQKWEVTSWYRDPATNRSVGGASNSRHLYGDAIDFYCPGMNKIYQELAPVSAWKGGIAIARGSFVHIDIFGFAPGESVGRRWEYS